MAFLEGLRGFSEEASLTQHLTRAFIIQRFCLYPGQEIKSVPFIGLELGLDQLYYQTQVW